MVGSATPTCLLSEEEKFHEGWLDGVTAAARRRQRQADIAYLATDSEWDRSQPDAWLSTAFAARSGVLVFVRPDLPEDTRARLRAEAARLGVELAFVPRDDATNLLLEAGMALNPEGREVGLLMYFSPKDVEYALGWDAFREGIEEGKVRQRNSLSGKFSTMGQKVTVKDLCGWAGKASLARFAASMGVEAADKGNMDDYKERMHRGLLERPEDFLRYAVGDVRVLLELHSAFVDHFQALQRECLGMDDQDIWTADDIPMTTGSLVARTLERWLHAQAADRRVFRFAVRKLGLLDPDAKGHAKDRAAFRAAVTGYRTAEELVAGLDGEDDDLVRLLRARFLHTALDASSVGWWASRPATETTSFLALVHGGRCVNEMPFSYSMDHGLDVDISGCYGEALRSLTYPVGLPTAWGWTPNEQGPTLGEWLDRHQSDLLSGLWMAVVDGPLGFEQDLVHSRLVRTGDIRRAALPWEADEGDGDTPGDFVLLRREVRNGVVTHDVLEALRKVATNTEWSGLRNLRVVAAAAYRTGDRVETLEDWCDAILADGGSYSADARTGMAKDDRTRAWVGVPLEGFVGRLADRRKEYKSVAREATADEEDRARAAGMEQLLKLSVNTTYGVLSSRFFPVGNTVVANNITARVRVGVWMLAKALCLRQSITDGGTYTPGAVPIFEGKRPGLNVLSRMWEWPDRRRGRWVAPVRGLDWAGLWDDLPPADELDRMALDHVRSFWEPYGLEFPFAIAHKADNCFSRGAYWSKGDYALQTGKGMVYAVRGKDRARGRLRQHPTFQLLDGIVVGEDGFPQDLSYTHRSIMRIAKWRLVQQSAGYERLKGLRPGDDHEEVRAARYNNNHFPLADAADYLRRRNRRKVHRGREVSWFERFASEGIDAVHRRMAANRLR